VAARPGIAYYPMRYPIFPFLSVFLLTDPMTYTMGRFLPERYRPAFYDSAVSFVHPITGLFPHATAGELFVHLASRRASPASAAPWVTWPSATSLVGLLVILIRGIVTELITARMTARRSVEEKASP
jgi:PTS system glucitol/sorbitol-specific IIC component